MEFNVHAEIHGAADDNYGKVADAFAENFAVHDELGAAVVVYVDGAKVVDLWGGIADQRTGRSWVHDTPAVVFSVTKGVLAICAYRLEGQGRLDLDAPVVRYWPEFGAHGKSGITVRMLLSHRAGLSALDGTISREEALSWAPVIRAIERQAPLWEPGSGYSYHTMTYGWLIGEVIRRITGLTPGAFLQAEICDPLGLDFWIGAPPSVIERAAHLEPPLSDPDPELAAAILDWLADEPHAERAATTSGAYAFPVEDGEVTFNASDIQRAEVPGANGIGTADGLAGMYSACVADVDGARLMSPAQADDALVPRSSGRQVFGPPDRGERWGTGFSLDCAPMQLLGPRSFGHGGAGGEMAFADAQHRVGFAYINNRMGGIGDPRATLLTSALRSSLGDG
jgi:CubicO group peptidase (beta-lactamase class C family)